MKQLSNFTEELNECAERALKPLAQQLIGNLLYAKLRPHLKRSTNLAQLEIGKCEQIVAQLETELELSGSETERELFIPTMTTTRSTANKQIQPEKTEQQQIICRNCKKNRFCYCRMPQMSSQREGTTRRKTNLPKDQMQNDIHIVHTAIDFTT